MLRKIESLVRSHPDGLGITELEALISAAGLPVQSRRTVTRQLATLVVGGQIAMQGRGPATRYYIPHAAPAVGTAPVGIEDYPPLTPDAQAVRTLIQRPLSLRPPIGYNQAFLRSYQPGRSWYLPESIRRHLHDIGRTSTEERPAGTFAHGIFERLLIDLAWASSRLEGNTYTRLDTENLLAFGTRAEGKDAVEAQMLLNHKKAIELLVDQAEEIAFNRYTILNLHAALSENLLGDSKDEGRVRSRMVGITGTAFVPLSIPQQLDELLTLLLETVTAIPDAYEQAFFVMVHLPYLQPFADVNKRTSRLAANIPLIRQNLCPMSFVGTPEEAYVDGTLAVYEFNRVELLRDVFVFAYERSCAHYRVVRDAMPQPDPIRLRYRTALTAIVHQIVTSETAPDRAALLALAADHDVPDADRTAVADTALGLLLGLHDGSVSRYGIRPSEFAVWSSRFRV